MTGSRGIIAPCHRQGDIVNRLSAAAAMRHARQKLDQYPALTGAEREAIKDALRRSGVPDALTRFQAQNGRNLLKILLSNA